jgi:hypothetical protein
MNTGHGFFTFRRKTYMLAASIIAVGFPLYDAHNDKTFNGPAQGTFIKFLLRCKLCNSSVFFFFNGQKHMALCYGSTAADRISIKLFSKFTLELTNALSELFYILVAYVYSCLLHNTTIVI